MCIKEEVAIQDSLWLQELGKNDFCSHVRGLIQLKAEDGETSRDDLCPVGIWRPSGPPPFILG